jgi:Chitinase
LVDVENFTLLMKDLRAALGQSTLLTYAGYCMDKRPQGEGYKYIDVKAVDPYVDFVNIMAYDLVDAPQHQSALNKPSNYWDCQRSVDEYLNAGVSADKLVLGIPFYGRADFNAGGSINYRDILNLSKDDGYVIENWDTEGNVPYVTKNGSFYCGYDNPRSIAAKGEWILKNGMKGMMFWDYEGDDTMGTLRKALWNAVMKK